MLFWWLVIVKGVLLVRAEQSFKQIADNEILNTNEWIKMNFGSKSEMIKEPYSEQEEIA